MASKAFAEQQSQAIADCLESAAAFGDGALPLQAAAELIAAAEATAVAAALNTSLLSKPTLESSESVKSLKV